MVRSAKYREVLPLIAVAFLSVLLLLLPPQQSASADVGAGTSGSGGDCAYISTGALLWRKQ